MKWLHLLIISRACCGVFCYFRVLYFFFSVRGQDFLLFERITCIASSRRQGHAECKEIRFS